MSESIFPSTEIIPGVAIRVLSEALIVSGGVSTGNIGIVGTAAQNHGKTEVLSDYKSAEEIFGRYDAYRDTSGATNGQYNLVRSLELLFRNGARNVYAYALKSDEIGEINFTDAFKELLKDDVNILVAPELTTAAAKNVFPTIITEAENQFKDIIAIIGEDAESTTKATINNNRIIMVAPGISAYDRAAGKETALSATYTAAAVAGLLSSLPVQESPTNKVLPGVSKLINRYNYAAREALVGERFLVLEQKQGVRIVRGITSENGGGFAQITTRRIVDFAKAGIRQISNPFIGKLNNPRIRAALQGAIDGFLTRMKQDEALNDYSVEVTATRQDEIAGRAMVNVIMQPTFSIEFIKVTLALQ
jgi:hypothetical protein